MALIEDELKKLNISNNKSIFKLFSKKTESLSRLKNSFFNKIKKAEDEENIEKIILYYKALEKTIYLSDRIYDRLYNELKENINLIQNNFENYSILKNDETEKLLQQYNMEYLEKMKILLEFILNNNNSNLLILKNKTKEQIAIIENLKQHENFIKELEEQKKLHYVIQEENNISEILLTKIKEIEITTLDFSQKIKKTIKIFNNNLNHVIKEIYKNPTKAIFNPIEKTAYGLEKYSSRFSQVILTLTIASGTSALFGFGGTAILLSSTLFILAQVGEGLQALPATKNDYLKFKRKIMNYISNSHKKYQLLVNV